ncbi:glycine--tRNA ligase subunit beta [Buchnera aphidicola]|uniref:Glycine--tRNA ligase beta subunit n=1 Tax=Buchnera aphidicola (Anoecia oenotherae) TaxID=1241833 RepID=A0A4D6Y056_9GAMM|nr:glycine--tRNA ligase subunit beta [Buchnera aphidicola]QCI19241.1 glycine--tRNA ligase subunit beta [Buchnera aphidicola (Anoecia oenotherae)]
MKKKTLLVELITEELPAKNLFSLSRLFSKLVVNELTFYRVKYKNVEWFSSPRRLAIKVNGIDDFAIVLKKKQEISKTSFFLKSKKIIKENEKQVQHIHSDLENYNKRDKKLYINNTYVENDIYKYIEFIFSQIVLSSLKKLTLKSTVMRWSNKNIKFIRPVRNILVLLDKKNILVNVFGIKSNRLTFGHFYMNKKIISVIEAKEYPSILKTKGQVLVDHYVRKDVIVNELKKQANLIGGIVKISEKLLEEVTSLVEWPEVLVASFPKKFLSIPSSIITYIMERDQKFFPIFDKNNNLINKFLLISNIIPKCSHSIVHGNEKVIVARLSDAKFFFSIDRKKNLKRYFLDLKNIIFHTSLGSLLDRSKRIIKLVKYICRLTNKNNILSIQAAKLSKCDLVTNIVREFPEMQGKIGSIYALLDGENKKVALAIKEQYFNINKEEDVPDSDTSCNLSLADKIDMLVGMFVANSRVSSNGDPFGMRRSAIGLILIILKRQIDIKLDSLINTAVSLYKVHNKVHDKIIIKVKNFLFNRIFYFYANKNYNKSVINSVLFGQDTNLISINNKINFISNIYYSKYFIKLISLYKRLDKILKKNSILFLKKINFFLLRDRQERVLYKFFIYIKTKKIFLKNKEKYKSFFFLLHKLTNFVDYFFKKVLVNDKNIEVKTNRLSLLNSIFIFLNSIVNFSYF